MAAVTPSTIEAIAASPPPRRNQGMRGTRAAGEGEQRGKRRLPGRPELFGIHAEGARVHRESAVGDQRDLLGGVVRGRLPDATALDELFQLLPGALRRTLEMVAVLGEQAPQQRSEEHTSELQS